jgi:hypothetical protein
MPDSKIQHIQIACLGKDCTHTIVVPLTLFHDIDALSQAAFDVDWLLLVGIADLGAKKFNAVSLYCRACARLSLPEEQREQLDAEWKERQGAMS